MDAVVYYLVARAGAMDHAFCGGVLCDANAGLPTAEFVDRRDLIMLELALDIDEKYNDVACGGDPIGCESSLSFKTQVWLHVAEHEWCLREEPVPTLKDMVVTAGPATAAPTD